jgi:poly-beta-1,6-N-acetyl-D-glucosamine synthase
MFTYILLVCFVGSTLLQLFYWLFVFSKLAFQNSTEGSSVGNRDTVSDTNVLSHKVEEALENVSVIICARNEASNLERNLPFILQQNYPFPFEIIVVNDASKDNTATILKQFATTYSNLKVIDITEKKIKGKKGALAVGIEAAQYEWLLLTDADCYPLSKNWVFDMMKGVNGKEIGLAYAPYQKRDGFLNKFIRFETVWTATQYMGFALAGEPYMGVGRNLIYKKNLYKKAGGFEKHQHIASGDDDLFINSVISKKNFKIILEPTAFMYSLPKTRWNEYFTQKNRHFSTSTSYILRHQIMLGILSASHFLFFVTAFLLLALKISTIFVLILIVVRTLVVWYFYGKILRKFQEEDLLHWIPFLDVVYLFFYLVFLPALTIRAQKW